MVDFYQNLKQPVFFLPIFSSFCSLSWELLLKQSEYSEGWLQEQGRWFKGTTVSEIGLAN